VCLLVAEGRATSAASAPEKEYGLSEWALAHHGHSTRSSTPLEPADGVGRETRRVQYDLYERGLTDCEINATNLRIKLRERRENEHTDCLGSKREPSDYVRTTPGQLDSIPPLDSLPSLIADQAPIVIPE